MYALRTCVKTTYFCNPASLLSTTSKERLGCSVLLQLLFFNTSCILQPAHEHRKEGLGEKNYSSFSSCSYAYFPGNYNLAHPVCLGAQENCLGDFLSMLNHKLRFCKLFCGLLSVQSSVMMKQNHFSHLLFLLESINKRRKTRVCKKISNYLPI